MGRQLYETQPTFRRIMDECDEILREDLEKPLLSVLYPKPEDAGDAERLLNETMYAQPALLSIEVSSCGTVEELGHSTDSGDGPQRRRTRRRMRCRGIQIGGCLKLVARRGRFTQELDQDGAMAAVSAPEARLLEAIQPYENSIAVAARQRSGEHRAIRRTEVR